ncbi:hypothetical protein TCSYLVIO_009507, partial [Trypanosoma cruzi]
MVLYFSLDFPQMHSASNPVWFFLDHVALGKHLLMAAQVHWTPFWFVTVTYHAILVMDSVNLLVLLFDFHPLMTVLRVLVVALALLLQLGLLFLPVLLFVPAIVVAVVFAIVTVVSLLLLPLLVDTHLFPFLLLEFLLEILLFALTALKAFRDFLNFQHLLQRFPVLHLRFDFFFLPFLLNMLPEFFRVILHFLVPLVVDLMCLFLSVKVVLVPARHYRHSNDHQAKRQQLPYPPLHHIYRRRHRTTARRGHTPAAHGQ